MLREVRKRARRHNNSSLGGQTFYLKGRRYRYKVTFSGQGPHDMYVYRAKRRKRKR